MGDSDIVTNGTEVPRCPVAIRPLPRGWMDEKQMAEECGVSPTTIRTWMKRNGVDTRDLVGENHPLHGEERDEAVRERISNTLEGREFSEETRTRMSESRTGRTLDDEHRANISESLTGITRSEQTRERTSEATAGEANPNWRGGYSRRYGSGWMPTRENALQRDGNCQNCRHDGSEHRLEVHHIIPVAEFRESEGADLSDAHDLRNLVTLCRQCHPRADHGGLEFTSGIEPPL